MPTPVWCPHCGAVLSVPDGVTQGTASCPGCRGSVDVAVALVDAAMRELNEEGPASAASAKPPAAPPRSNSPGPNVQRSPRRPVPAPQPAPPPAMKPARPAASSAPHVARPAAPLPAAPPAATRAAPAGDDLLAGVPLASLTGGSYSGQALPPGSLQPKQQGKSWDEGTITLLILGGIALVMCGGILTAMTQFAPTRRILGLRVEGDFYPERGATTVLEEPGVFRVTVPALLRESNSNDRWTTRHYSSYSDISYSIACRKGWVNTSQPHYPASTLTLWLDRDIKPLPGAPRTIVETSRRKYEIAGHPALEVVTQDSRTGAVAHYLYIAVNQDMVTITVYHEENDPEEVAAFFNSLEILAVPAAPAGVQSGVPPGSP